MSDCFALDACTACRKSCTLLPPDLALPPPLCLFAMADGVYVRPPGHCPFPSAEDFRRYFRWRLHNDGEAEEALSDLCMLVIEGGWLTPTQLWLAARCIARNRAARVTNEGTRTAPFEACLSARATTPGPLQYAQARETMGRVLVMIEELDAAPRQVLILCGVLGRTQAHAAEHLGITQQGVAKKLEATRAHLRQQLASG
jgi:DNA-directed RNA polymerase specialized sigma24 family protein